MGERNGAVVSKHALRGNNIFPKNAPVGRAAKLGSSIRATNIQPPTPVGTHLGGYKLRVSDHEWKCVPPCSVDDSAELPYINAKMQTKKLVPTFLDMSIERHQMHTSGQVMMQIFFHQQEH